MLDVCLCVVCTHTHTHSRMCTHAIWHIAAPYSSYLYVYVDILYMLDSIFSSVPCWFSESKIKVWGCAGEAEHLDSLTPRLFYRAKGLMMVSCIEYLVLACCPGEAINSVLSLLHFLLWMINSAWSHLLVLMYSGLSVKKNFLHLTSAYSVFHSVAVEIRGQFTGVRSPLPLWGAQGQVIRLSTSYSYPLSCGKVLMPQTHFGHTNCLNS